MAKARAIVLHSIKYGETQLIVDVFTDTNGFLSFIVKIPKSAKSRMKRQYFQPLSLLSIEFDYRPKANLQHFKDVSIAVPFISIPFSPYKLSISIFLAELLDVCLRNEQKNESMFLFVFNSILWLDKAEKACANFHVVFMMRLTIFMGFFPNIEEQAGRYFDLQEGCFVNYVPVHSFFLNAEDAARLRQLFRLRYETMHLYAMSREERNRCVDVILSYYRLHVSGFSDLKTYSVLKELFV